MRLIESKIKAKNPADSESTTEWAAFSMRVLHTLLCHLNGILEGSHQGTMAKTLNQ